MNAIQDFEKKAINVLFVCPDNARHSLIAESLLRSCRVRDVRAFSAGIDPADKADTFALSALTLAGLGNEGLWPKHWGGFADPHNKLIDIVVVIGADADERLPRTFPGSPAYVVWRFDEEAALRNHHGVWRDIQLMRPHVEGLADDLRAGVAPGRDAILAEAAE